MESIGYGSRWVEFELAPASLGYPVAVRLGDFQERWVAVVHSGSVPTHGLGTTARGALLAALAPLGERAIAALMAEPMMFGASASLLAGCASGIDSSV
jgi:hypothetical protein